MPSRARYGGILVVLSLLAIASQALIVAIQWHQYNYDFRAYYLGSRLLAQGLDPYSLAALEQEASRLGLADNSHPFVYMPHMLWLMAPASWLPYPVATTAWVAIQLVALSATIYVVGKRLGIDLLWLSLLAAFGFNGAVASCLRSGQLSIVESLLLAFAICGLRQGGIARFAWLTAATGTLKLWLTPLLGLAAIAHPKRGGVMAGIAGAGIAALYGINLLAWPELTASFRHVATAIAEGAVRSGPQNGSLYNLIGTMLGPDHWLTKPVWISAAAAILVVTLVRCRRIAGTRDVADWIWIAMLAFFLVSPRVMTYQWVPALPAIAWAISSMPRGLLRTVVLALAFTPTIYVNRYCFGLAPHDQVGPLLGPWAFSNVLGVLLLWVHHVRNDSQSRKS